MATDQPKDGSKYFYAVAFITIAIAGVVVWQVFLADHSLDLEPNAKFEKPPLVDFAFLDSSLYKDLDPFQKGDQPLLAWKKTKSDNPFEQPLIPQARLARDWWGVYAINFEIQDQKWIAESPQVIAGKENPDLILFEDRWYKVEWPKSEDNKFVLKDEEGEIIDDVQKKSEEGTQKIIFQADRDLESYESEAHPEKMKGSIRFAFEEINRLRLQATEEELEGDISEESRVAVQEFQEKITESYDQFFTQKQFLNFEEMMDVNQKFAELDKKLLNLILERNRGEVTESGFRSELSDLKGWLEYELKDMESYLEAIEEAKEKEENKEVKEEQNEETEEVQIEEEETTEANEMLTDVKSELDSFKEQIMNQESNIQEEVFNQALEDFEEMESDFITIRDNYKEGKLTDNELENKVNQFEEEAESEIDEIIQLLES